MSVHADVLAAFAIARGWALDDVVDLQDSYNDYAEHREEQRTAEALAAEHLNDRWKAMWRMPDPAAAKAAAAIAADPRLDDLAHLVEQRDHLDEQIQRATCFLREWVSSPPPLARLAAVLHLSNSGVRVSYDDETRSQIAELTGRDAINSRDPQGPVWSPQQNRGTPEGHLYLGVTADQEPVTIPAGTGLVIDASPRRRDTYRLARLLSHQILARYAGDLTDPIEALAGIAATLAQLVVKLVVWADPANIVFAGNEPLTQSLPSVVDDTAVSLPPILYVSAIDPKAPAPKRTILIGNLTEVTQRWASEVSVLTAPQRSYDWRWTLTTPTADGNRTVTVRISEADDAWLTKIFEHACTHVRNHPDDTEADHNLMVFMRATLPLTDNVVTLW
jgi:hypothetical protein